MTDFSDRPLVAGSIYGARSFVVTPLGVLTGVTFTAPWSPGVNSARCMAGDEFGPYYWPADHRVAGFDCSCGFYAYTDTRLDYARRYRIDGIVRGEGVATVGSRGFRVERAEIVALVDKDIAPVPPVRYDDLTWLNRWRHRRLCKARSHWGSAEAARRGLHGYACSLNPNGALSAELLESVKLNYPGIPWFRTIEDAVKAFPLSTPPAPDNH